MKIETGQKQTHWPSLLILIFFILSAGTFILGSIGLLMNTVYLIFFQNGDPVGAMIAAMTTAFEGVLLLSASWYVFQRTSGSSRSNHPVELIVPERYIVFLISAILGAFSIGSLISVRNYTTPSLLLLPWFTILVILIPIIIFANIAMRKIYLGSRWQVWAVFGLGMTLAPLLIILIELILAGIFIIFFALAIASQPTVISEFLNIVQNFDPQSGQVKLLEIFTSLISKPGIIAGIMLYLAVIVPMVEELLKPLGVWLFSKQISQPSQGFALGIVSGAAFAIIEGFGISSQGGTQWPVVVGLRAGTSLLHITTTGLMGYAITSALKKKRLALLVGTYFTTVLIHGLWNAAAAGMGISVIAGFSGIDQSFKGLFAASLGGIAVLATGLLIMLPRVNRSLAV